MRVIASINGWTAFQAKIALVTGATSGIGFEASVKLAAMGATLVLVARDRARGEAAVAAVKERSRSDAVSLMFCDFASLSQVRALAAGVMSSHPKLHILVNNAGSASPKREGDRGRNRADLPRGQPPRTLSAAIRN